MSNKLRNPFKMRASEKIESDANFLKLFSPEALEPLVERNKQGVLWDNVMFIRSSPGAGKTSLLRIFEAQSLNYIFNHKSQDYYKDLFGPLKKLGVLDNKGVRKVGVILRCTRNYEILEDIDLDDGRKKRLFYALLNSRIILATLKSLIALRKDINTIDDLAKITFSSNADNAIRGLDVPCNGKKLYDWASGIERSVYEILDSFLPIRDHKALGHNEPFSTSILRAENLLIDGGQIVDDFLFMIDDAHKLSMRQRESYLKYLAENRGLSSIWISERLEALTDFRSFVDRDFNELNLEYIWGKYPGKFRKVLGKISLKRASISTEDVTSFQENLVEEINETVGNSEIEKVTKEAITSIEKLVEFNPRFNNWYNYALGLEETGLMKAVTFKGIEILMQRQLRKKQLTFEFDLTVEELKSKLDSTLESTARLFTSEKSKIPYYYGFGDLSSIATNNIDQFLTFSSELYEAMISEKLLGNEIAVSATNQDKIFRSIVKKKWEQLSSLIPDSKLVKVFIDGLGRHFKSITYKPTASYAPGINGFAINEKSHLKLIEESLKWQDNDVYRDLREVITTCLTYNLLEARKVNQGTKGQVWQVYYLNKWLCVRYDLPLGYGMWNKITPEQLSKWAKR